MKDVAAALRSLGLEVTPKTLANFADADTDGDGALRLTEFKGLVASLEQTKAGPDSGDGKGAKATSQRVSGRRDATNCSAPGRMNIVIFLPLDCSTVWPPKNPLSPR